MSDKKLYRLTHKTARAMAVAHVEAAPDGYTVEIREPRRTDEQSRRMHAMADDLSKQVPYMGMTLTREQWKRFATAKLKKDTIVFDCDDKGQPNPRLGLLVLGAQTRDETIAGLKEIIDWMEWFGAQHGVIWSDEEAKVAQLESMRR